MEIEELTARTDIITPQAMETLVNESLSSEAKEMEEMRSSMEILSRVDLDLAYSDEKLANLDNLLMRILTWENEVEAISFENDDISPDSIEKVLALDHLSSILSSEIRQLDNFIGTLQDLVTGARQKITCRELNDLHVIMENKFHDTEELLRQSKERVLEMKMQLAKSQMTSLAFDQNEWRQRMSLDLSETNNVSARGLKPHVQTVEQRRTLRMLEKSLERELDLEKKLTLLKQNEDDLKLKLRLTEQVALCMEEGAEVIWGRFLESENAAEVLMGISREMVSRLQIVNFNLNGSLQRERDFKLKIDNCLGQVNAKDITIQNLNSSIKQLTAENAEVSSLRDRLKILEDKLKESESKLLKANELNEVSEERLKEMECVVESQKEDIDIAEHKAENAEEKVAHLTETNLELHEELDFLKSSNESNAKKVSILEKQVRELEIQLQNAKTSSEAGQEQQNMLYSAIWDMETLIDELKQKVLKAESKTEHAEEQCIMLSETNLELNKEVEFLRSRVEGLETSLNQATIEKIASAKDINIKTSFIMDLVMQLAIERERVQKQIFCLTKENKSLIRKLETKEKQPSIHVLENGGGDTELSSSRVVSTIATSTDSSHEIQTESTLKRSQVDELPPDRPTNRGSKSSMSINEEPNIVVTSEETEVQLQPRQRHHKYIIMSILVLLLSTLGVYFFGKRNDILDLLVVK
ncbi:WPP domain-interacting tail-anchored protein 2-like [Nicotiana tabacum]|uniref:WPP domain-interacting tail-anchored protein 2-like n=1 Tax=Nicotiana tabacum TaxID=4097 RepID=A0A1S4AUJ2_TOBAC|nr:WPP domain-interacting tail-anchored protein 2 [Nicotiana tomentosiformis]XP_009611112.1 WPP domain-interacting tail-anchored protein 2 [Nicotiana tomentosiformis]XP_016480349.1 PREDICTED: WPP domain-interacting tail-anchored protein 2-like [Nicotiana tabacum]XP_016480350.1 PREDICTED: WPP domain-interacting tail-anchored protein 2-like [Nicotiana tabacum]XP_016480351.1 PREDICTED: WPP domain-interacting tail-anchored protein 2-like [Nicotiana tabacum]XP_033514191.1 WPP domain-interacting tai